jgi:hypothetical protein
MKQSATLGFSAIHECGGTIWIEFDGVAEVRDREAIFMKNVAGKPEIIAPSCAKAISERAAERQTGLVRMLLGHL